MNIALDNASLQKQDSFINGKWISAESNATFDVINPSTLDRIVSVPDMGPRETTLAIDAASAALPAWSAPNICEYLGSE